MNIQGVSASPLYPWEPTGRTAPKRRPLVRTTRRRCRSAAPADRGCGGKPWSPCELRGEASRLSVRHTGRAEGGLHVREPATDGRPICHQANQGVDALAARTHAFVVVGSVAPSFHGPKF